MNRKEKTRSRIRGILMLFFLLTAPGLCLLQAANPLQKQAEASGELTWSFSPGSGETGIPAQQATKTIRGKVTDANGQPLPGVTIVVKGTTTGTITDADGNYSLSNVPAGATLVFSFVGMKTQEIPYTGQTNLNITLTEETIGIEEVVAIGYGTVRKEDATGSVATVSADEMNRGIATSPSDLLTGKTAGVQIVSSGAPGSNATIRIRGGSSLTANNDPLVIIDGVPVDQNGMGPLSTLHPDDIKTYTVLKDASATAIYGSRASNGVILITTKVGGKNKGVEFNYDATASVSIQVKDFDVLNADEYRAFMKDYWGENSTAYSLLGNTRTDWQDKIFQTPFSNDHNLSATGNLPHVPYRVSLGYTDRKGTLKNSWMDRYTAGINLSPSLLNDHLNIKINIKAMRNKRRLGYIGGTGADDSVAGAIGNAIAYDPTQEVYDDSSAGLQGYRTWRSPAGEPQPYATENPVAAINQYKSYYNSNRIISNIQMDYKFHFLPELKVNLNVAYDGTKDKSHSVYPLGSEHSYHDQTNDGLGRDTRERPKRKNELIEFYANYSKELPALKSSIDAMAGYSWQHFHRKSTSLAVTDEDVPQVISDTQSKTENYLVSFFGRVNYNLMQRYLLTFTLRDDGSSRFRDHWGLFPSAAFAWRISEEKFLGGTRDVLSDLKLRLSWGKTGQQDINNDYAYIPTYSYSTDQYMYQFGDEFIYTLRPNAYDKDIKWEETETWNIGLDFGVLNNRITGTFDAYKRKTTDLLNTIPVAAGSNLSNYLTTNVGSLENKGVEFSLDTRPVVRKDISWNVGVNLTYNKNEITKLTATDDPSYSGVPLGYILGAKGATIQVHQVGHPTSSFLVYQQVYDSEGKPIEGEYVDRNQDGSITEDDKYVHKKPAPDVFIGFNSKFIYRNWDCSLTARASLGNYVYNNIAAAHSGLESSFDASRYYTANIPKSALKTNFVQSEHVLWSDYYIEDASFLKIDNITLGYSLQKLFGTKINARFYTIVQDPVTITGYSGMNPEVYSGIDGNVYPRSLSVLFGVNLKF